ncbi:hypothetical protein NQ314_007509 [Rhamnusium bicolor]|uniref:Uncharacterized protein n=1 Tax=Rhamnusium bicolor TaxID=1586634 RepID=A0AAV8YPA3_9CUCU|nr:hypothetical protein NQ314_007509 [Rhamnusium bicolor]
MAIIVFYRVLKSNVEVAMIIGVAGACQKSELIFLRRENVVDKEPYIKVRISTTKTNVLIEFAITHGT